MVSNSQTYYIYTATNSGLWTTPTNWTTQQRTDGVQKNKVIIPVNISITADDSVNTGGLGNVEIIISGNMSLSSGTNLDFSANSSIELNNGSISGNAANQKIKIGNDTKYRGNVDGVISGYFLTNNTTGSSPLGFVSMAMLPVNFTSFYISKSGQNIQLSWSTDKEINNNHFEVERSSDGLNWEKIALVFSTGNANNSNNYNYNDKTISSPVVYYRLRQVDINGRFMYSSIKTIRMGENISPVKVYGFEKNVVIDLNSSIKGNLVVSVVNNNGQVISKQTFSNPSYKINLGMNVTSGAYIVHVSDNKGWSVVRKVIL